MTRPSWRKRRNLSSLPSLSRKRRAARISDFRPAGSTLTADASNAFAAPGATRYRAQRSEALTAHDTALWPWLVLAASGFFWMASFILLSHNKASSFGADSTLYTSIAYGDIQDRLVRFHPVTVALAFDWMKLVSPAASWVEPRHLMTLLFAAVGGLGVWAALSAFRATVPARYVLLCGLVYACSLGTWYFSAIAESKIVTASLATIYIALYLQLRDKWTAPLAWALTGVLAIACLNEIVSAFLIVIPAVDTLLRRGLDRQAGRSIALHALAVPMAFFILDVTINGRLPHDPGNTESGSLFKMFWFYAGINDHSVSSLYSFLLNWFFFNIAAPTPNANAAVPLWPNFHGYFQPSFANYFTSLTSAAAVVLFGVMVFVCVAPAWRPERQTRFGLALPLIAYTALRGGFFFIFNPAEAMLFSAAVTLPHLMIVLVPFAASKFPAKMPVLAGFALLLFLTNLRFMVT